MIKIVKVAPLTMVEAKQVEEAEKQVGVSLAVYETRKKEYFATLEKLKAKYDPEYSMNSKSQIARYSAVIKDGHVVLTLE